MSSAERQRSQVEDVDLFSTYIESLENPSVFTREEEQNTFHKYHLGLATIRATISSESFQKNPVLSLPTLRNSINLAKEAFESIVLHNQGLVISIAKHTAHETPFLDRIQNGNFGLYIAIDKFDPSKGFKFSTYATRWIKNKMIKFSREQTNGVYVPDNQIAEYNKLEKFIRTHLLVNGCLPSDEDCTKKFEWNQKKLDKVTHAGTINRKVVDFDLPISDKVNSITVGDTITDPILDTSRSIENSLYNKDYADQMEVLNQALKTISESIESGPKFVSAYIERISFPEVTIQSLADKHSVSTAEIVENLAIIRVKLSRELNVPQKNGSGFHKEKQLQLRMLPKEYKTKTPEINLALLDTIRTSMKNGPKKVAIYIEYNYDNKATLQEIGTRYGVSRERIRQIVAEVESEIQLRTIRT